MQYSSVEKEPTAPMAIRKRPHLLVPVLPYQLTSSECSLCISFKCKDTSLARGQ